MMTNASRINNEALVNVAGGDYWDGDTYWTDAWATVASGYLALRSYPDYDDSNELKKRFTEAGIKTYTRKEMEQKLTDRAKEIGYPQK